MTKYTYTYTQECRRSPRLDPITETDLKAAVESSGISTSRWIARIIQEKLNNNWPQDVRDLLGAWPDLLEVDEIRATQGTDVPRESL